MQAIVEQGGVVRLPTNRYTKNRRIQRASSVLEQELERSPSPGELATFLNIKEVQVAESLTSNSRHVSLDSPLSEGEDGTLLDVLENTNAGNSERELYHKKSLQIEISRSLQVLTVRQRETIQYIFGIGIEHPMSLDDIGIKFNITPERVRQIKEKAIVKLRMKKNNLLLRGYLGN